MVLDVFYFGKKPNAHPRELPASSLTHARQQSTTEHFWIINEFCDYKGFDWDFDFEFLPDEDVWAEEHNNVWPSNHQADSGTWLCPKEHSDVIVYRADVPPINRKNEPSDCWVLIDLIDETKFDFSWHPDPREPAYIYTWGNNWYPAELAPSLEYHVPGATERKYMTEMVEILPDMSRWNIIDNIDQMKFDFTWRPDPREPAYIYTWGNKWDPVELSPSLEYHCVGATERKYMAEVVDLVPDMSKWVVIDLIDQTKFDLTWRPDPREPAYIYTWGNRHVPVELAPSLEYHCPGATERKYMTELVDLLPDMSKWKILHPINTAKFDLTWRPDPREPAYIYTWGNKWNPVELSPSLEYHVPGATERKYMVDIVSLLPDLSKWNIIDNIDKTKFDLSWIPDPREPAYIYVWGNKHILVEIAPSLEYHVPGATERKYITDVVELIPDMSRWNVIDTLDETTFDFTWRPDPREPAYIYVWGNKHVPVEIAPSLEYHVPGATERKYITDVVELIPDMSKWNVIDYVDKTTFDFTWRPDPREPAYIYVWGNKWDPVELAPSLEYHVPGATERKYMSELVDLLPDMSKWKMLDLINMSLFDFTWRPDPREPAYIYTWGNKWDPVEISPCLEYHVPGATARKYMSEKVELLPEFDKWKETQSVDREQFDFTWRPDPREPAYIYVWGNKHIPAELVPTIEYYCPGATERKYMGNAEVLPQWDQYKIIVPLDKTTFDFTWRPDPRDPAYIYTWGNQSNSAELEPTLEYHCLGATERKYMSYTSIKTTPVIENWKILIPVETFDFSWRPDPTSPPYIYVFGNQWHSGETEPTVEYHVAGATERKYTTVIAHASKTQEHWKTLIPVESFDYSWRPNPHSSPFIYVFGNQWNEGVIEPTVEYHAPGATDRKYITDVIALVKSTSTTSNWKKLISIESFDYSWRPDPTSPPYIYVFGNKWNDSSTEPSVEYHVEGATDKKYMNSPVATPNAQLNFWSISNNDDLLTFDFSWRPNPFSPPQIYQWANNGPRYTVPGATEVVFVDGSTRKAVVNRYKIETTLEDLIAKHSDEVFWAINPDLKYDKFNFNWKPNEENFRHINVFGNEYSKNTQTYYVNGPMYALGYKKINYVEEQTVEIDSNLSMFFIDHSNKESTTRFNELKLRYPQLIKTRYLNSWVDTITRCVNKSSTTLFWVLDSNLSYTNFEFDFYPSPWQMKMVHVFGTQWSHWGTTFMINKETFAEDTKYVKIIEHLSMLNFVKSKKATAVDTLYDIIYIDHGNKDTTEAEQQGRIIVKYETSYLNTFKNILEVLPTKKAHYIWVTSSICDYTQFDFSYICDPYAKDQLHVFPSDKQKFGDTFLIDVNKLRTLIDEMIDLEDYEKINFNPHQRVARFPAPKFVSEGDTHTISKHTFNFPYADFVTKDSTDIVVNDETPMSVWAPAHKILSVKSTGGTVITIPKEAKAYVKRELYDYPYISKATKLAKSNPLDIVFLSNGETKADENYEHLLKVTKHLPNKVKRVDGVNGRVAAYHAAANASDTAWALTVFAKLKVNPEFDWSWQPDRLQVPKHYIFHATNPVNGLEYGHQGMIAYNKQLTLANTGVGLDFTLDDEHEVVEINSGTAIFNTDAWSTWRTSFREAIKLRVGNGESKSRLHVWLTKGGGDFAEFSIAGARHAIEYYEEVAGDPAKLRLSYDWAWLKEKFNTLCPNN